MSILLRISIVALLLDAAACYRPTYGGPYSCDPRHAAADCPEGFRCLDRLCVAPGAEPPDMSPMSGCKDGGTLLVMAHGARAWACPGTFAQGQHSTLCSQAPGTHVCGAELRDDELLTLLDCDTMSGFYAVQSNVAVMRNLGNGSYDVFCDAAPGGGGHAILGCGNGAGAVKLNPPDCHSLHHALTCPASNGWSCGQGLSDAAHDATVDAEGGTLCCATEPR